MAPQRKSSGGTQSREKQQRSIASFFSAAALQATPKTKPVLHIPAPSIAKNAPERTENLAGNSGQLQEKSENAAEFSSDSKRKHSENDDSPLKRLCTDANKRENDGNGKSPSTESSLPESRVGKRLEVFWPLENKMFPGVVESYDKTSGKHKIIYDDGDEEEVVLTMEKVVWLDENMVGHAQMSRRLSDSSPQNNTGEDGGTTVKLKRLRKRYVTDESDCEEDECPTEGDTNGYKDLQVAEKHIKNQETSESTKRRRLIKSRDAKESPKDVEEHAIEINPSHDNSEAAARFKNEICQAKEPPAESTVIEAYGGDQLLVLKGEALERFGGRVSEKFYFLGKGRKDASGRPAGTPNYNPRTLFLPSEFVKGLTGGQKQWWEFKAKHMDKVMLFKMGKFYEMFEMDAHIGAQDLELQYMKGDQPHCGFPEKNYSENVERLVRKGHRVLVVEQTETPEQLEERKRRTGAKDKVVRREICAVITKGTLVDSGMTGDTDPSFLLALTEKQDSVIGLCVTDTSRALFMLGQVRDDDTRSKLRSILTELRPVELVLPHDSLTEATEKALREQTRRPLVTKLVPSKEFWDADQTLKEIKSIYKEGTGRPIPDMLRNFIALGTRAEAVMSAFGGCISYLRQVLIDKQVLELGRIEQLPGSDLSVEKLSSAASKAWSESHMVLDSAALENLEILENNSNGGTSGTLLSLLDHCITPFGRRLLKQWIVRPLVDVEAIVQRQKAVEDIQGVAENAVAEFRRELAGLPDVEKLLARLSANSGANGRHAENVVLYEDAAKKQIKEFVAALRGCQKMLKAVSRFAECLHQLKSDRLRFLLTIGKGFPDLGPLVQFFENAFDWSKAEASGRIIVEDNSLPTVHNPKEELERYLKSQQKLFSTKEISYVTVGKDTFLLEIPEELHAKVPSQYELRSSRKGYRRYWTPRVKGLLQELSTYENEKQTALKGIFQKLTKRFCEDHEQWLAAVRAVSELDALMSLSSARLYMDGEACRPTFLLDSTKPCFSAKALRHPIVAVGSAAGSPFVPNDIVLGGNAPHFMLLTGPNMGGKSTLLRQVCLAMILAQIGAEVPAEKLELSPTDRLFVRMGAKDHIMSAQSTFLVELLETAVMLRCASRNSFVALDELGRGTATSDGQAIAHAVLHHLAHDVQCRGMFSSHYHKLANDCSRDAAIAPYHMACKVGIGDDDLEAVTFLYKLTPGPCPKSYGVNVAKLAGMPDSVLRRATIQSAKLEQEEQSRWKAAATAETSNAVPLGAEALQVMKTIIIGFHETELASLWRKARQLTCAD